METKHTRGPWKMHPVSSVVGSLISWGDLAKGENICAVMPQKTVTECEVIALLIAAAPDLLAALEAALPNLEWANIHGSRCEEILSQVKAAIRKAQGE